MKLILNNFYINIRKMQNIIKRVPLNVKIILAIFLTIIFLGSCGSGESKPKVISGFGVFNGRCVTCHGADGRMGLNGAKVLPESTLSLEERIAVVSNGRNNVMPAFKDLLTKEEIEAVAKYTMKLK